jgi:hypothetical protein
MVDLAVPRSALTRARVSARSSIWLPLGIFAFTRVVGALILMVMSDQQGPRIGNPGLDVFDPAPADPGYLDMLTNWDGQWYVHVAEHGYPRDLPVQDGEVARNAWAFFPVYPALVRAVVALSSLPFAVAASVVSMAAGAGAMVLVFRLLEGRVGRYNAGMTVLAMSLSPAGVLLQAAYTESVALLVLVACLTLLVQRRYGWLAVMAVVLSLTRPIVLPLALLILVHGVLRWRRRAEEPFPRAERRRWVVAVVVSGASFGLWPLACALWTGEPDGFLASQQAWISNYPGRASWLLSILHDPTGRASVLALSAAAVGLLVVARRSARPWGSDLRWWVPVYTLYLLGTASPVASSIRYALLAVVPWWPFTGQGPELTTARKVRAVVMAVLFGVACQVAWVRFFYVLGPDRVMFP